VFVNDGLIAPNASRPSFYKLIMNAYAV